MIVVACLAGAAAASALVWVALRGALGSPRLSRANFRGSVISGVGGVGIVIVSAIGSMVLLAAVSGDDLPVEVAFGGFQLAVGFGVLGFLDDVAAQPGGGGFLGHLRALRGGRVTTGLVKLAGGGFVALLVAALASRGDALGMLRDAVLIAAGANLANLFDRAPGRTTKVAVLVVVALVVATGVDAALAPAALAVGAAVGTAWWELREAMMLGDTGVNVVGALLALGAVATLGATALWIATAVVVALNLLSERVSFSRVIDATGPLRAIDRLGRRAP